MTCEVETYLINRFNVVSQTLSRAMTPDDKYWFGVEIIDLAKLSAEPSRGERPTLPPRKSGESYF